MFTTDEKVNFLNKFNSPIGREIVQDLQKAKENAKVLRNVMKRYQDTLDALEIIGMSKQSTKNGRLINIQIAFKAIEEVTGFNPAKAKGTVKLKADKIPSMHILGGIYNRFLRKGLGAEELAKQIGKDRTMVITYVNWHNKLYEFDDKYTEMYDDAENRFLTKLRRKYRKPDTA